MLKGRLTMNPQLFGKEHLIYIAVSLTVAFFTFLVAKNLKSERSKIIFPFNIYFTSLTWKQRSPECFRYHQYVRKP